jgi:hypothetical protein
MKRLEKIKKRIDNSLVKTRYLQKDLQKISEEIEKISSEEEQK